MSWPGDEARKMQDFWLHVLDDRKGDADQGQNRKISGRPVTAEGDVYLTFRLQQRRTKSGGKPVAETLPCQTQSPAYENGPMGKLSAEERKMISEETVQAETGFFMDANSDSTSQPVLVEWEESDERFLWLAGPIGQTAH